MASSSREKKFIKDSEILQILEESDSEVSSLFHSEDSDTDSENNNENPEVADDDSEAGVDIHNTTANWSNHFDFEDLQEHKNNMGPNHNLPFGSCEKDFFELFVDREFFELVANQTNIHAKYLQKKSGKNDNKIRVSKNKHLLIS